MPRVPPSHVNCDIHLPRHLILTSRHHLHHQDFLANTHSSSAITINMLSLRRIPALRTTFLRPMSSLPPFSSSPSPPRLPPEEQAEFERLQREAAKAPTRETSSPKEGEEQLLHPDVRRGAEPEFEGDVNPVTGEVGGPKREPARKWIEGDWSFNGRVTDF